MFPALVGDWFARLRESLDGDDPATCVEICTQLQILHGLAGEFDRVTFDALLWLLRPRHRHARTLAPTVMYVLVSSEYCLTPVQKRRAGYWFGRWGRPDYAELVLDPHAGLR
jgi:hypothetical protein